MIYAVITTTLKITYPAWVTDCHQIKLSSDIGIAKGSLCNNLLETKHEAKINKECLLEIL